VDQQQLFEEAHPVSQALVDYLLGFAVDQVHKRGTFVPFGATFEAGEGVRAIAASDGEAVASSLEMLPLLHEALRQAQGDSTQAVAVCEWVKITPERGGQTDAAKVLVEHVNGLSVAFYLPLRKKLLGKWETGEMLVMAAPPEVGIRSA